MKRVVELPITRPVASNELSYYGKFVKVVGRGTHGVVALWTGGAHGQPVAVKIASSANMLLADSVVPKAMMLDNNDLVILGYISTHTFIEIALLRIFNHSNVMFAIDISTGPSDELCMILPWASHGVLSDVAPDLVLEEKLELSYKITCGLAYIHSIGIFHGDIKPENILIFREELGKLHPRIADFGLATLLPRIVPLTMIKIAITVTYRPPEMLLSLPYTLAADVWSLGATLYELFTNEKLVIAAKNYHYTDLEVFDAIVNVLGSYNINNTYFNQARNAKNPKTLAMISRIDSVRDTLRKYPRVLPSIVEALITLILQYDPSTRPTSYEILRNNIFDGVRDITIEVPPITPLESIRASVVYPSMNTANNQYIIAVLFAQIVDIALLFKLKDRTLHSAFRIIDSYLANTTTTFNEREFILIGSASLHIASQYIEHYAPEINDYVYQAEDMYSSTDLSDTTNVILRTIEYNIIFDTVIDYRVVYQNLKSPALIRFLSSAGAASSLRFSMTPEDLYHYAVRLTKAYETIQSTSLLKNDYNRLETMINTLYNRGNSIHNYYSKNTPGLPTLDAIITRFSIKNY